MLRNTIDIRYDALPSLYGCCLPAWDGMDNAFEMFS